MARANGEGTIKKRSDGRWEWQYVDTDGKRRSIYARTEALLVPKITVAQGQMAKSLPVPTGGHITVSAWLDEWFERNAKNRIEPTTAKSYQTLITNHLKPVLGRVRLDRLTTDHIHRFVGQKQVESYRGKLLSPRRIQMMLRLLSAALNAAVRSGRIGQNVVKLADKPEVKVRKAPAIGVEAANAIIDAFDGHAWQPLVTVALYTGLREGELIGLRWSDVDLDRGKVRITSQLQKVGREWKRTPPKSEPANAN